MTAPPRIPSDRCLDLQRAALLAYAAEIPSSLRESTLRLQAGLIAFDRQTAAHAPKDTICLVTVSGNSSGSSCGITAAEIRQGAPPSYGQGTFSSLVPNGVATVTLSFRAAGRVPAHSVTAPVSGNVYAVHDPHRPAVSMLPAVVVWRASDGHRPEADRGPERPSCRPTACRREPVAVPAAQQVAVRTSQLFAEQRGGRPPAKP